MARYRGSSFKKARRLGFSILETGKEFSKGKKREYAPGQHGQARRKMSGYALQLAEKQKVRYMYGLTERQFKNTYKKAKKIKDGITGHNFLFLLETRLDNLTYRLGFASTRRQARQLVNHGHILLDGKKADIPSIMVKPGQKIEVREKSKKNPHILAAVENAPTPVKFIEVDGKNLAGVFKRLPERSELNQEINESQIVEWYNRSL